MKNTFCLATALQGSAALSFVIPSGHGPFGPPKVMKNTFCLATALQGSAALSFVIPRGCDFFTGMSIFLGHTYLLPKYELSSRPERSAVEGPAVLSISTQRLMEARPSPLSSSSAAEGSAVPRTFPGNVFRLSGVAFRGFLPRKTTPRDLYQATVNCETALEFDQRLLCFDFVGSAARFFERV
jgi:hypothetical protein